MPTLSMVDFHAKLRNNGLTFKYLKDAESLLAVVAQC